jgi:SCY1-like protein 1
VCVFAVKAMLVLVPKMSERTINSQLLKHFAKLQVDPEAGIRTNTTICLAKLAEHLSTDTRNKVLIPAFSRALKDPFGRARIAGLISFASCLEHFSAGDVARRVLPAISPLTVDPEKEVRDKAFEGIQACVHNLQSFTESMPETVVENKVMATATGGFGSAPTAPEPSGGGWLSSISTKIAPSTPSSTSASGGANTEKSMAQSSQAANPVEIGVAAPQKSSSLKLGGSGSGAKTGGWDDVSGDDGDGWENATDGWDNDDVDVDAGATGSGGWETTGSKDNNDWDDGGGGWDAVDAVIEEEGGPPPAAGDGDGWEAADDFDDFNFDVATARTGLTSLERREQRRRGGKKE